MAAGALGAGPIAPERLSESVAVLASGAFEGAPGTAVEVKTVDRPIARLKAPGMEPGVPGGQ